MSRSGDTPATSRAPARTSSAGSATESAASTPAGTTPVAERAQLRARAEQEARDVLAAHATEPDSETLQRVRDLLTETEGELERVSERAHAAAFSVAFYDGAAPLANRYLQISRPSWMVRRRQALDVQGPWLSSAGPEQVRERALERGIAHDPQAMITLPGLAAELITLEERVRALRELRKDLVRRVYRANPATMINPEGLSQTLLAQWSGLTPGRISQLISQSYRAKPARAELEDTSAEASGEHTGAAGDEQGEDS